MPGDGQAGGEGHPVVGVDDVERFAAGDLGGEGGVALDLGEQVAGVVRRRWPAAGGRACSRLAAAGRLRRRRSSPARPSRSRCASCCDLSLDSPPAVSYGSVSCGVDRAEGDVLEFIEAEFGRWATPAASRAAG